MTEHIIRKAQIDDADAILALLTELAAYEKLLDKFHITRDVILRDYLCDVPLCHCEVALDNSKPIGVATWHWTYTSFAAARGIYLEDLFVSSAYRGRGYGKAFLVHLAKTAIAANASRVEWSVLDWNTPSIDFYETLGARRHDGWYNYRLADEALSRLAQA